MTTQENFSRLGTEFNSVPQDILTQSFNLPMKAASDFWKDKIRLSPGQFSRLSDEARIRAFAVSGIARGAELETVFTALRNAIDQGDSFDKFKKECGDIFTRRGWVGDRAWRVDNIFRTNIQTAYNAGQYKQQTDEADGLPYWMYSAINDSRTRPTHLAMNGRVWPANHRVWNTWYPPNGYRCRCSVIAMTEGQVKRRGLKVEEEDITNRLIEPISPVSGEKMPGRAMLPDIGFEHNPGKLIWGGLVDRSSRGVFKQMPGLHGPEDFRRPKLENVRASQLTEQSADFLSPGMPDEFYKEEFLKRHGEETVLSDASGDPVILSLRSFLANKMPGAEAVWKFAKDGHGESIPLLQEMIEHPFEIWLTPQKDEQSGRIRLARRYVSLWKTEDKTRVAGLTVFEVVDGVFQGVTAFIPLKNGTADLSYVERQRRGLLLYPRR
jgi:SPP1 gp7 family putative phage head morphogenesis protein